MAGLPPISFTVKDNKYYFQPLIFSVFNGETRNVGDIIIDVSELSEFKLLDIITKYPRLNDFTVLQYFEDFTEWFFLELLNNNYGYAMSFFIKNMFLYYYYIFRLKTDFFMEQIKNRSKDIKIFSSVEFDEKDAQNNIETVINMALIWVSGEISVYKDFIPTIILKKEDNIKNVINSMELFVNPFSNIEIDAGIKYKIDVEENEFIEVFSTSNLADFLKFEFCQIIKNKIPLTKCANCGRYFLPENRSDTMYCNRPSPQEESMTCKEYGGKRLWYDRLRENKATKLYRNIYMAKQMLAKNNPDVKEYKEDFEKYKVNSIQWKKYVKAGIKTEEEFITWLKSVKGKKGIN